MIPEPDEGSAQPEARRGLGRRLFTNYTFQLLNQAIRIGEQILLVPLFIAAWGADLYRDWIEIYAIVGFAILCNFGLESYFGNLFLRNAARGDDRAVERQLAISLLCALVIGSALALTVAAGAFAFDLRSILHIGSLDAGTVRTMVLLMVLPVSVLIAEQVLHTLYRAYDELNRGECVFAGYSALQIGSVAVALVLGQPPWVVATCYLVVPLLFVAGLAADLKTRYRQLRFRLAVPSAQELREFVPQSLLYFMLPLSTALVQYGTFLLLGVLGVGSAAVVAYSVYRTFTGLARQAANQFAFGGGVEMARHFARGDLATCARLYDDTGRIVAGLVGVVAGLSTPAAGPFVSIWTHGVVGLEPMLLVAFFIGMFLAAPGQAAMVLLKFTNEPRPCAAAWAFHAVGGLLLCALLVPRVGVAGAAAGFAVSEALAFSLYLQLVVQRKFGFSAWRHWARSYAAGGAAFALSCGVAFAVIPRSPAVGLVELLGWSALWAAIVLPPAFFLFLTRAQRASLIGAALRRFRPASVPNG
jgi:O-antigen/teichoic acid export membrane protein